MVSRHAGLAADEEGAEESGAICRHIANLTKLVGPDVQDAAKDLEKEGKYVQRNIRHVTQCALNRILFTS